MSQIPREFFSRVSDGPGGRRPLSELLLAEPEGVPLPLPDPARGLAAFVARVAEDDGVITGRPDLDPPVAPRASPTASSTMADPPWLRLALGERSVAERPGAAANPRILEYFASTWQAHADDSGRENAWCAAFVTWSLSGAGVKNGRAVGARAYQSFGEPSEPFRGAIVVLQHGKQKHVAFLAGVDAKGNYVFLGGNQNDRVSMKTFPAHEVLAIRKPPGFEVTADVRSLPLLQAPAGGSTR